MSLILLRDVQMAFGGQDVLRGASGEAPRGARIGIVGPNGGGKSTLLHIIAGLQTPTGGSIQRARDARVIYVAQEPEVDPISSVYGDALNAFPGMRDTERRLADLAHDMAAADASIAIRARAEYEQLHHEFELRGGYSYESEVQRTLSGLGLTADFWNRRAAGLSGGERARLALAKALLQQPDVLLLDEPTNHLDLQMLDWLEGFLSEWRGTLITVSHDRYFLDRVVSTIWELRNGRIEVFPGNYSHYAVLREERDRRRQDLFERQQEEIARQEEFIRRYRNSQKSRQARGRQKQLNRLERIEAVQQDATVSLGIDRGLRSAQVALRLNRLVVEHPGRRGEALVTAPQVVEAERGSRIAIVGPNGAGKTTLLGVLAGERAPLSGRVEYGEGVKLSYFRQAAEDLDPEDEVLMSFLELRNRPISEARDILARFLFRHDEIYKMVGDLSGGERARLALARVFGDGSNVLLLDEPTNHLDLPSREALEQVLPSYQGVIIFVSHDRRFIDTVATHVWSVEDGRLLPVTGNWTEFQRLRPRLLLSPALSPVSVPATAGVSNGAQLTSDISEAMPSNGEAPKPQSGAPARVARAEERRLAARVRDLERAVTDAEAELAALHNQLELATQRHDVERVTGLGTAIVVHEQRLHQLMADWEAAAQAAGA